jgi:hypothetical protein
VKERPILFSGPMVKAILEGGRRRRGACEAAADGNALAVTHDDFKQRRLVALEEFETAGTAVPLRS